MKIVNICLFFLAHPTLPPTLFFCQFAAAVVVCVVVAELIRCVEAPTSLGGKLISLNLYRFLFLALGREITCEMEIRQNPDTYRAEADIR